MSSHGSGFPRSHMTPLDELFTTDDERDRHTLGEVVDIFLTNLHDFPNHPFKVRDDERMKATVESVKAYGVLVPIIVRETQHGEYEIIAGHRRKRAAELAGLDRLPAIIRHLNDDEATIIMVDSNLQREQILPSERAAAYKMKLEAMKRQGERWDLTCTQVGHKSNGKKSVERVAEDAGESKTQVQRIIRLTELEPKLQEMVDSGKMALTPAVELSYLQPQEQALLLEKLDNGQAVPSLAQAQQMKKLSKAGDLNAETMLSVMTEQPKHVPEPEPGILLTFTGEQLKKYFPTSYTPEQMESTILNLLDSWMQKRLSEQS